MFHNIYVRLALWYTAIIMAISLVFSIWVYREAMNEVRAGVVGAAGAIAVPLQDTTLHVVQEERLQAAIERQYAESQGRLLMNLVFLNAAVLVAGGLASYALARRTLQPVEDALEAQNRFTADASHELRTPLAAMKAEIEVALRDPQLTGPGIKELLQSNLEEIDRMSSLTQGLLSLARSDEQATLAAVRADKVVRSVCKRLQPLADAKKIIIKKDITSFQVVADDKSLETIVRILLDNAIKYSPEKSVITVTLRQQDAQAVIAVTDQGPGIPPADLPHIFERFYRADSSRTTQHVAGHGLGLSIAQKIADAMHATIHAKSTLGKGSVFSVQMPIAQ
jgi:two-component system sensor histidine kinase CiaH